MYHNGTMFGLGKGTVSDSRELADTISECEYKYVEDIAPLIKPYIDDNINRLVFFEDNGRITIMNEHLGIRDDDNTWHSNDYHIKKDGWCRAGCKPKPKKVALEVAKVMVPPNKHKVFVYGTLKRGYANHGLLLSSTYLGKAKTKAKWSMIGVDRPYPYVLEKNEDIGHHVAGEVFLVSDAVLHRLNQLEGVPSHYNSQLTKVMYTNDLVEDEVLMYVKTTFAANYADTNDVIAEWVA